MMDQNQENMLREVMAADFSIIELNLYLDTHPNDQNAIAIYNNYLPKVKEIRDNYEKTYGPLTVGSIPSTCPWQWIKGPWPWEK